MACCKVCCGCVECDEGQEGKCCCGGSSGTCCQVGEYCCSGVCQAEPCDGCEPCDCDPDLAGDGLPSAEGEWAQNFTNCVMDAGAPYDCILDYGSEWLGMGDDEGMYWDEDAVGGADGCTILAQIALYETQSGYGKYVKLWKCTGANWVNVTDQVAYADVYAGDWMCSGQGCDQTPPFDDPPCDAPPP